MLLNKWHYLQFDDVLELRKCHIINRNTYSLKLSLKYLSLKFVQEIFEMRSSTSAVGAFPVGLSNNNGCNHKIQATVVVFFSFLRDSLPVHHCPNYSLFLLTLNAYPNRPCYFMPGYLAMCSYFCLECSSWNVVHWRNPIHPALIPFYFVTTYLLYASKYILTTLNYNDLLGFHPLNCKFPDGN